MSLPTKYVYNHVTDIVVLRMFCYSVNASKICEQCNEKKIIVGSLIYVAPNFLTIKLYLYAGVL